jgi:hypothetical protein
VLYISHDQKETKTMIKLLTMTIPIANAVSYHVCTRTKLSKPARFAEPNERAYQRIPILPSMQHEPPSAQSDPRAL